MQNDSNKQKSFFLVDSEAGKRIPTKTDELFDLIFKKTDAEPEVIHENLSSNIKRDFEILSYNAVGYPQKLKFSSKRFNSMIEGDATFNNVENFEIVVNVNGVNVFKIHDVLSEDVQKMNHFYVKFIDSLIVSIVNMYRYFGLKFIGLNGIRTPVVKLNPVINGMKMLKYVLQLYDYQIEGEKVLYFSYNLKDFIMEIREDDSVFPLYKFNGIFKVVRNEKSFDVNFANHEQ